MSIELYDPELPEDGTNSLETEVAFTIPLSQSAFDAIVTSEIRDVEITILAQELAPLILESVSGIEYILKSTNTPHNEFKLNPAITDLRMALIIVANEKVRNRDPVETELAELSRFENIYGIGIYDFIDEFGRSIKPFVTNIKSITKRLLQITAAYELESNTSMNNIDCYADMLLLEACQIAYPNESVKITTSLSKIFNYLFNFDDLIPIYYTGMLSVGEEYEDIMTDFNIVDLRIAKSLVKRYLAKRIYS